MAEKKKFYQINLPLIGQSADLLAVSEAELSGKTVKVDLTRKLRGKSLEATYKLKPADNKIQAVPYRLHLLGYFIRRMMRKSISYVEDSFASECKNAILRIKPFLITRKKVSAAVRKALRNKAKELVNEEIKNRQVEEIFSDIISGRLQKSLSLKLKKTYPLALCEIRDIYVEKELLGIKTEKIS